MTITKNYSRFSFLILFIFDMPTNSKLKIRKTIFNVFTKKYGLHVQSDATKILEDVLASEEDLTGTLEKIIKTYKKRYHGMLIRKLSLYK